MDLTTLKQRINELKKQGFLIAIDDIGKGNSDLRAIIELEPEYIKFRSLFFRQHARIKTKTSLY